MNPELKHLLLRTARLGTWDTRWLLRRLDANAQAAFAALGGPQYLAEARRFRHVPLPVRPTTIAETPLPAGSEALARMPPLFIAIVLDTWPAAEAERWLSCHDTDGCITDARQQMVPHIQDGAREALVASWSAEGVCHG